MKTTLSFRLLAPVCIALLSFFAPGEAQAQANPYPFKNNLPTGCAVTLDFQIDQFTPPSTCTQCNSQTSIVVNPGATVFLNWGSCVVPICDIYMQVVQIGTTTGSPLVAGSVNTAPPAPISVSGCGSNIKLTLSTTSGNIRP